ncbi:hypothetical protein B5F07_14495 [Lachnoclostridium sp. An169]|uniref:alanyl-tRNA editing protein n=1 Tax=Lachnoclostridium sp. An169 TaxID=1965569 RepID=UPI000B37D7A8|nr:DHHA1 domain-containing protein [Lachnoclostridium sp. An169]OUP82313.1 hypothetical protein B5F07_14495 [Lachnoclostridium sp. An169]HJA66498.1 hypothetical protein [Candidatus Mediterraneibacter cottocaccae]
MTEKLFYRDSHLREFTAAVTACRPCGKDDGREKAESGDAGKYEVELDRTAFFPEGGGQYSDKGVLGGARVLDVREKDGHIFHITDAPLEMGEQVTGKIDWEERFMKMQQHTGEHIVSGLVHGKYGYNNVGFHLGSEDCTMDFNGELTEKDLLGIEREANRAVWENLEVQVLYPTEEELEKMEYRSKIEIEGQVRIVVIPGYDVCACCAPHVKYTGEIGVIKLTNVQRYKGGVRVTMLCGIRALLDYEKKQQEAGKISAMLCAKENEIAGAVSHLREECSALKYELGEKEKKIVLMKAQNISDDAAVVCEFVEEGNMDSMRLLMNSVLEKDRVLCAVFGGNDEDGYRYVIGSRKADVRALAKEFNAAFDGKGGGRPEMVQGTANGKSSAMREWILEKAGNL